MSNDDANPHIADQLADLNADVVLLGQECRAMAKQLVMIEVRLDSVDKTLAIQTQLLEAIRGKLNNLASGLGVY